MNKMQSLPQGTHGVGGVMEAVSGPEEVVPKGCHTAKDPYNVSADTA